MLNRETPVSRFSRRSPTVFRSLKSFRETSSSPSVSQRMPFFREHPLKSSSRKVPVDFYRERERERENVSCDPVTDRLFFLPFFFILNTALISTKIRKNKISAAMNRVENLEPRWRV